MEFKYCRQWSKKRLPRRQSQQPCRANPFVSPYIEGNGIKSGLLSGRRAFEAHRARNQMRQAATTENCEDFGVIKIMKQILTLGVMAAVSIATIGAAHAQTDRSGRYTMHKTDDGFVRLDTETGAVSLCQKSDSGWGCNSIAGATTKSPSPYGYSTGPRTGPSSGPPGNQSWNDIDSAISEIDRLSRENAELKAEVKRQEELLGLRGDRAAKAPKDFKLPTEKEVDQALNYVERMLKKFQERLKRFEQNAEPKAPERQL